MNYLLTIINTDIADNEFVLQLNRFMEPIVETDARFVQYNNGLLVYHFDTLLDPRGLRDHIMELMRTFGVYCIVNQISSTTIFGIEKEQVDGIINLGPDISLEEFPFIIYPVLGEESIMDDSEYDRDEVVQMLMQKYKVKEVEPTLDEILDKIHEKGISSLSIQEQAVLNQFK